MVGGEGFAAIEVGQGAGDLEDAVMGAGGEIQGDHGLFEIGFAFGVELAVAADLPRGHGGVGARLGPAEAAFLTFPRLDDAFADAGGGFAGGAVGKFAVFDQRDFHMEVDAVQQGSGDSLEIVFDLPRGAPAFAFRITVVAARAGVECRDEHRTGGKGQ